MSGEDTPIRTLQGVYSWLATTENWIARMLSGLPNCEITILSGEHRSGSYHDPRFLHLRRSLERINNPDQRLAPRIWNAGIRLFDPVGDIVLGAAMRGRIDVVHSHFSFVGWRNLSLARALKVPHVVSFYGFDYENLPFLETVWTSRYKKMFSKVDCFVCEGVHGAGILRSMGCPSGKIRVVHLGVEPSRIPFAPKPLERSAGLRILQLASLTEKKGHGDAIRAFAMALPDLPAGSTFTVAGRDADVRRRDLAALAEGLGVSDSIHFLDGIDFSKLHDFLGTFHVFLHPSKYTAAKDCEGGAPVVLLDAQACGVPVVSTRHCDIPGEVVDGVTGFLADEGDIAGIAEALRRMAGLDDDAYDVMRRAGRSHVETHYDAGRNAQALREVYRECIREAEGRV